MNPFALRLVPRTLTGLLVVANAACHSDGQGPGDVEWAQYAGSAGGARYSPLGDINRTNVQALAIAWVARAGDFPPSVFDARGHRAQDRREDGTPVPIREGSSCGACHRVQVRFESTPLMVEGSLLVSTPLNRVLALDPSSGREQWSFDPGVRRDVEYVEGLVSRGVAVWRDREGREADARCSLRVFLATVDARLLALDGEDGTSCVEFGDRGAVSLLPGVSLDSSTIITEQYGTTSPPTVIGDLVVVGSAVGSHAGISVASGVVRAYDTRSGVLRWSLDPIPRSPESPGWEGWRPEEARGTGGGNAWSMMSADEEEDLLLIPTASAAPDHFGGLRQGRNDMANSVVAVRGSTGEVLWWQQLVHHDLWDYDVAAQPILLGPGEWSPVGGGPARAVLAGSKTGMLFLFDAESGDPLAPVEELPVPVSDVPAEDAWPTQPFSPGLPNLHGSLLTADSAFGITTADRQSCQLRMGRLRNEGLFTPPSLGGSLLWPGAWGGVNWDGLAWDPTERVLVVAMRRLAMSVRLVPRAEGARVPVGPGGQVGHQAGTDYLVVREPLLSPDGTPCTPPPWGLIGAIRLPEGRVEWLRPLGTVPWLSGREGSESWGSLLVGGPLVTAGGLVFIGGTQDDRFRALDLTTGETLWEVQLPAGAQAAPMTYRYRGKQYVVVTAGGRAGIGSPGDWIVAFAIP